jgi:hypothetical protein
MNFPLDLKRKHEQPQGLEAKLPQTEGDISRIFYLGIKAVDIVLHVLSRLKTKIDLPGHDARSKVNQ